MKFRGHNLVVRRTVIEAEQIKRWNLHRLYFQDLQVPSHPSPQENNLDQRSIQPESFSLSELRSACLPR